MDFKKYSQGAYYLVVGVFVAMALIKMTTGINLTDMRPVNNGRLRPIVINNKVQIPTTWDGASKTLTSEQGSIKIESIELQPGRTGTYKTEMIVRYQFTAGEKPIKPRNLLTQHFYARQGEDSLIEGMMNESSPPELIEAQNNSILLAEKGASLNLVEVYELRLDDWRVAELVHRESGEVVYSATPQPNAE